MHLLVDLRLIRLRRVQIYHRIIDLQAVILLRHHIPHTLDPRTLDHHILVRHIHRIHRVLTYQPEERNTLVVIGEDATVS